MHFWSSLSRLMTSGKSWRPSDSGWASETQVADSPHVGRGEWVRRGSRTFHFTITQGLVVLSLPVPTPRSAPMRLKLLGSLFLLVLSGDLGLCPVTSRAPDLGVLPGGRIFHLIVLYTECQTTPFDLHSVSISQGNTRQSWTSICQRSQGVKEFGGVWEWIACSGGVRLFLCLWGPMV